MLRISRVVEEASTNPTGTLDMAPSSQINFPSDHFKSADNNRRILQYRGDAAFTITIGVTVLNCI